MNECCLHKTRLELFWHHFLSLHHCNLSKQNKNTVNTVSDHFHPNNAEIFRLNVYRAHTQIRPLAETNVNSSSFSQLNTMTSILGDGTIKVHTLTRSYLHR